MEAGIRELRDNLSRYIRQVRDGAEVTVTDHGTAVARILPVEEGGTMDRLVAEGIVAPPTASRRSSPRPTAAQGTVSDLVAEQRR